MKLPGNNIFWDLDGVLRKLSWAFRNNDWPQSWDEKDVNGRDICESIDANLDSLEDAPEAEYIEIARMCEPLHVVSAQPDLWRPYTSRWFDDHLPEARVKYLIDTQDKLKYLVSGKRVLIEDCPNYPDYTYIILVDRPYNKDVVCERRVHNPEELMVELRRFLDGQIDNQNVGRY
jgi:hypothetical protein